MAPFLTPPPLWPPSAPPAGPHALGITFLPGSSSLPLPRLVLINNFSEEETKGEVKN